MLRGIFPVIPSLFADDGSLALDEQRKVVRFALDAGAHGLVFPGVASEYQFLAPEERRELLALVADETGGTVPIVGGASAPTTAEAVAAGRQALEHGISHLMIMAPGGLGDDLEAHRSFFAEIAAALDGAEIMLQNAPAPVGAGLDAKAVAALVSANPAITCVKEESLPSGPAITALQAAGIPHLKGVFGGGGARFIIDELDRGALGAMPAVELADLHVALYEEHAAGNHHRARELYQLSLPLLTAQAVYRMRLTKHVLHRREIAHALRVRAPLPELDECSKRGIDRMVDDLEQVLQVS